MTKPDSLEILKEFNSWRRGDGESDRYDRIQTHLGVAIDEVINELARLRAIEKAAINMCDVKGRHHSELAMNRLMEVRGKK